MTTPAFTVGASNLAAIGLYQRAGFKQYAVETRGLKVGDRYYDELLMALRLAEAHATGRAGFDSPNQGGPTPTRGP